mgnify:CR=1 FL=1
MPKNVLLSDIYPSYTDVEWLAKIKKTKDGL